MIDVRQEVLWMCMQGGDYMKEFYWIHLHHWYYGDKEAQFYKNRDEKKMRKFLKEHLADNWVVDCMKIMHS